MAKILVISPTPTHPQDAGNRARICSLLSELRAAGHQIGLAFVAMEEGDLAAMQAAWGRFWILPYSRPAERRLKHWGDQLLKAAGSDLVMPYGIDDWFDNSLLLALAGIAKQFRPDVALVEYAFLSKAFEAFPQVTLKLLDTHDALANRHHRLRQAGLPPMWFYTTTAGEKKALQRADCILAIQEEERLGFSALTRRPAITVGHLARFDQEPWRNAGGGKRLLFVGSVNPLNVAALNWFVEAVFPLLRQRCPEVCLEIVGDCAQKIPAGEGLLLTGRVEDLGPCYRRATAVVNPVRTGTGLKIKAIEALAMGCPMVSTRIGCTGLETGAGKAFYVADTADEFAEAVHAILVSEERQIALSRAALAFSREYNCQALQPLLSYLELWSKNEAGKHKE